MPAPFEWNKIFTWNAKPRGARPDQIAWAERTVASAHTNAEIEQIMASQQNPFRPEDPLYKEYKPFDPRLWRLPQRPFPPSYVSLLQWSDGGEFAREERGLFPLFACDDLRGYMLQYHVPEYMPGALPFGMNGGGEFYLLDMRHPADDDQEYPVLQASAGNLCYVDAEVLGSSIWHAFSGNK